MKDIRKKKERVETIYMTTVFYSLMVLFIISKLLDSETACMVALYAAVLMPMVLYLGMEVIDDYFYKKIKEYYKELN